MEGTRSIANRILLLSAGVILAAIPSLAQKKPKVVKAPQQPAAAQQTSAEPDKVLYDRAMADIKHGRYTEGRLALQTLINTYPDSEYLAKAKLTTADSYYKEGGTSNLTQAIAEYQDFTTFFPFLEEAAYAQMQVAMCHYKMMQKADRDDEQALDAEDSYQSFILKYPQSPLMPQAEQRLREVQEVLAQGEFEIAHYYYTKPDYPAAAARLMELTERYPLFSQSDEALFMLGDIYQKARTSVKNEDQKNHWADLSAKCYDRILTDYPLSKHASDAKRRLQEMSMPIPAADPAAYERMAKEQKLAQSTDRSGPFFRETSLLKMPMSLFNSRPDITEAAHTGAPNLNPPSDAISARDVLRPDAPGPEFNLAAQNPAGSSDAPAAPSGAGQADLSQGGGSDFSGTGVGAQIISTGGADTDPPAVSGSSDPPAANMSPDVRAIPAAQPVTGSDATAPAATNGTPGSNLGAPAGSTSGSATASAPPPASSGAAPSGTPNSGANAPASGSSDSGSSSSESTSKKKKGLHKLIPF